MIHATFTYSPPTYGSTHYTPRHTTYTFTTPGFLLYTDNIHNTSPPQRPSAQLADFIFLCFCDLYSSFFCIGRLIWLKNEKSFHGVCFFSILIIIGLIREGICLEFCHCLMPVSLLCIGVRRRKEGGLCSIYPAPLNRGVQSDGFDYAIEAVMVQEASAPFFLFVS